MRDHNDDCFELFTPLLDKINFNGDSLNDAINYNSDINHLNDSISKSNLLINKQNFYCADNNLYEDFL